MGPKGFALRLVALWLLVWTNRGKQNKPALAAACHKRLCGRRTAAAATKGAGGRQVLVGRRIQVKSRQVTQSPPV